MGVARWSLDPEPGQSLVSPGGEEGGLTKKEKTPREGNPRSEKPDAGCDLQSRAAKALGWNRLGLIRRSLAIP